MAIIELHRNADIMDLVSQMHRYLPNHVSQIDVIAATLNGQTPTEIAKKVWAILKSIQYKADGARQRIQTPYRLLASGKGDCKSYSIFALSAFLYFGVQCRFVFTNDTGTNEPNHVFVQYVNEVGEIINFDATICCMGKFPNSIKIWFDVWTR